MIRRASAAATLDTSGERVDAVARVLVVSSRVVPGLEVMADGRSRTWWWPLPAASHFAPGPIPELPAPRGDAPPALLDPEDPDAVLDQLENLAVDVRGITLRDALRAAYERISGALDEVSAPG